LWLRAIGTLRIFYILPSVVTGALWNCVIPEPVWAVGFALEQPLHVVALPCSALRILKQLEHNSKMVREYFNNINKNF
jgi:hypothetical protein